MNTRPLPQTTGLAGEFHAFCKAHELRFQRCTDCSAWRHVPRERCGECGSSRWSWERSSGHGRIFTWVVATRPMHPAFASGPPVAPVVVEMDEGVRLVSNVLDCPPEQLAVGMPVEVVFEDVTAEVTLPFFRRPGQAPACA